MFTWTSNSLPCLRNPFACLYAGTDESSTCHHISFRYILILSSQLHQGLSSVLFLSGFLTKTLYTFFLTPACAMCPTHLILLNFDHPNRLWQGIYMELNFMCLSLGSWYFLPVRSKNLLSILFSTLSAHAPPLMWHTKFHTHKKIIHTGCHRRNGPNFGRVFLMLNYTDITQNTYIQSWTVTEIMASEVWNFDSCYTLTDYQIHTKIGRNMWFL